MAPETDLRGPWLDAGAEPDATFDAVVVGTGYVGLSCPTSGESGPTGSAATTSRPRATRDLP